MSVREDPIKMHKEANSLMENGKYVEARDIFKKQLNFTTRGRTISGQQK